MSYKKILAAIDDYSADEHVFNEAVNWAVNWAKVKDNAAELHLLHILPSRTASDALAKQALQLRVDEAKALGVNHVESALGIGEPGVSICQYVKAWQEDDIVVMGHRNRAVWKKALGSVSTLVVQNAPCSVLVVRPPIRILVAMENPDKDAYVFDYAKSLAKQLSGSMLLLHILSAQEERNLTSEKVSEPMIPEELVFLAKETTRHGTPVQFGYKLGSTGPIVLEELDLLAKETTQHGISTDFRYRPGGSKGQDICDYAHDWNATIIVVGKHQEPSLMEKLLGRVSQDVVQHAACSVMVVHPPVEADGANHDKIGS